MAEFLNIGDKAEINGQIWRIVTIRPISETVEIMDYKRHVAIIPTKDFLAHKI